MENFCVLNEEELKSINGGTFEILIFGKVLTGAAAFGVVGLAVVGVVAIAGLAFYVAAKNN